MDLEFLVKSVPLDSLCCPDKLKNNVSGGYAGDLLSDVIANSAAGAVWITRQAHQNIIAVASLKDHAGIIIAQGSRPDADTLARAEKEGIPVMVTGLSAFEVAGKIYRLLHGS